MHRFEPGVFFTHNFTRKKRRFLRIMRQLGDRIVGVGVDEEGLEIPLPQATELSAQIFSIEQR